MSLGLQYKNQEHIFDEKTVDGVPFLSYPMLEETGIVHHGFSTKLGGVSKGCWATMNISTSGSPTAASTGMRAPSAAKRSRRPSTPSNG